MDNMLQRGARYLSQRLGGVASTQILYRRGATGVALSAVKGASTHQGDTATGGLVTWEAVDWIVKRAELSFDGGKTLIEPKRGDMIDWIDPRGDTKTYEVINPLSEDAWTNSDEFEYDLRIHSQLLRVNV